MPGINLATFRPTSADELLHGIVGQAAAVAAADWDKMKGDIGTHLASVATAAFQTQADLKSGAINQAQAAFAVDTQRAYLKQILNYEKYLIYATVQDVLNAVFAVIAAAIKNYTGIQLAI